MTHEGDGDTDRGPPGPGDPCHLAAKGEYRQDQEQAAFQKYVCRVRSRGPRQTTPLNQLFITEQQNGDLVCYRYQLQLPSLQVLELVSSDWFKADRDAYVEALYRAIENGWERNQNDLAGFVQGAAPSASSY